MNLRRIVPGWSVIALPLMIVAPGLPAQGQASPTPVLKLRVAVMARNQVVRVKGQGARP